MNPLEDTRIDGKRSHIFTNPIFFVRLRRIVRIFIFGGFLVRMAVWIVVGIGLGAGVRVRLRPVRILRFRRHLAWLLYLPEAGSGVVLALPEEALPRVPGAGGLVRRVFLVYA
jgi:hypothetical protein